MMAIQLPCVLLNHLHDTERLGTAIANVSEKGDCICLSGDLGTGKTTLTQAIALGLKVPKHCYVTSPSFAIMHEYHGRMPLYHMDFYRLNDSTDILDLGLDEYFYLDGLTVIEWSERTPEILPVNRVTIKIKLRDDETRKVRFFTENDDLAQRYHQMLLNLTISDHQKK